MELCLTKSAAKGLDQLLIAGSNIKNSKKFMMESLSRVDLGQAPRDKMLRGSEGIHSIDLNNVNGFRGLVMYDEQRKQHVLIAALTHKEYEKTFHNPGKLKEMRETVKSGDYERVTFDQDTCRFTNLYNQASLDTMKSQGQEFTKPVKDKNMQIDRTVAVTVSTPRLGLKK